MRRRRAVDPLAARVARRYQKVASSVRLVGYHFSPARFEHFDMSKASPSAVWGPGVYLSEKKSGLEAWGSMHGGQSGFLYEVVVATSSDNVIDMTKPLPPAAYDKMEKALGRPLGASTKEDGLFPFLTLEKKYGTVAKALERMGFDVLIHTLNDAQGRHYLVTNPHVLKIASVEPVT